MRLMFSEVSLRLQNLGRNCLKFAVDQAFLLRLVRSIRLSGWYDLSYSPVCSLHSSCTMALVLCFITCVFVVFIHINRTEVMKVKNACNRYLIINWKLIWISSQMQGRCCLWSFAKNCVCSWFQVQNSLQSLLTSAFSPKRNRCRNRQLLMKFRGVFFVIVPFCRLVCSKMCCSSLILIITTNEEINAWGLTAEIGEQKLAV